jgi:hypothetical protein
LFNNRFYFKRTKYWSFNRLRSLEENLIVTQNKFIDKL